MASIEELKSRIDLHDLCQRLGLERPGGSSGNYKSPHHADKSPSLSVFDGGRRWKDHSSDEGGTCVDLVMYVEGIAEVGAAMKRLHEIYDIPPDPPKNSGRPTEPKPLAESVAERCAAQADRAREYLIDERGLLPAVVDRAIKAKAVGFNDYTSPKRQPGEPQYGGPAVGFVVRTVNPGRIVAVDTRYLDPALNGGVKTQCIGEKDGHGWYSDLRALERAHTVYIVESPINALSVECAGLPGVAAIATRGTGNVENIDWRFLMGKLAIVCLDNDTPNEKGHCPGQAAAWRLHEILTGLNIAALLVDQAGWNGSDYEWNDLNDILKAAGAEEVRQRIQHLEPWIIPGLPGKSTPGRKSRIYLPAHDFGQYWKFRAKADFVSWVRDEKEDEETGELRTSFQDVCGFRVASISRVRIAGATSVMTGEKDTQPRVTFAVSAQSPRHGAQLQRRVFEDERLHNLEHWQKFGPIYAPQPFKRMINILERSANLGARDAVNFVGLCWKDGRPIVNEGPDCYFEEPDKQCPYHNLTFPAGTKSDARRVIAAYQDTFKKNAAMQLLAWSLGAHLKAYLGFWPHMMIQADKGAGKTTLIKRLERTIGFTMFSSESIKTLFRMLTSISHTAHPVGWEEFSTLKQIVIDEAIGVLQQTYQYVLTRRGSEMTEYLQSAPVLLAGEDVPVRDILGKIVRAELTGRKGDIMPEDLPKFPVRQWLEYLTTLSKPQVVAKYAELRDYCLRRSCASGEDDGAVRMAGNYAAILTAWRYLCDFAGVAVDHGGFGMDLIQTMNDHIAETSSDRDPWVWIMEIVLSEIDRGEYRFPFTFEAVEISNDMGAETRDCLIIRITHIIDHIRHSSHLRARFDALPVKTSKTLRRQLLQAGVVWREPVERTISLTRVSNMVALDIEALARYGLHVSRKAEAA